MRRAIRIASPSLVRGLAPLSFFVAALACTPGCGDDDDSTPPGSAGKSGGSGSGGRAGQAGSTPIAGASGNAGNAGASGNAGNAGASGNAGNAGASGNAGQNGNAGQSGSAGENGSAGVGGASGTSGSGGASGASGSGGSSGACLDPSVYADLLALNGALPLCVTRSHPFQPPAGFSPYNTPTWGRHGGPLALIAGATSSSLLVHRWTLPAEPTAEATRADQTLSVPGLPAGSIFWGPAVDLPFFDWTLLPYTTSSASAAGEVLLLDASNTIAHRHDANGFYAGFGLAEAGGGRLFFTGLSPLSSAPTATSDSAVYTASSCALGFAGANCAEGRKVGDWESSSGPVAVDADGRGFFALSTFLGSLQVRGYARGALLASTPSEGVIFVQDQNYAQSLAALAPSASAPGYLFVDEAVGAGQSVSAVAYSAGVDGEPVKGVVVDDAFVTAPGVTARVFGAGADEVWVLAITEQAAHYLALRRSPLRRDERGGERASDRSARLRGRRNGVGARRRRGLARALHDGGRGLFGARWNSIA